MLNITQAIKKYGEPNKTGAGYLVTIKLPFPMRLSWDKTKTVNSIQCHKDVADSLVKILTKILKVYGLKRIQELGIDIYGGCFAYRMKTSGTSMSLHSLGIAFDSDPDRNLYKETKETARLARPEYKQMIDIFYEFGWESLGRERDYDWMHFQVRSDAILSRLVTAVASIVPITGSVKKKA